MMMNSELEKVMEAAIGQMKNAVHYKPMRYEKLVRVAWHSYFDPESPAQEGIAQKLNISSSLVSHYRLIFDSIIHHLNLTIDEYVLLNEILSTHLTGLVHEFNRAKSKADSEVIKSNLGSHELTPPFISKPPGSALLSIVEFLYSSKTVDLTFKPLIADWRAEYFEALKQGRAWKARWISTRYRISFVNAMTLSKIFSAIKQVKSALK